MYNVKTLNKIAACGTDLLDRSKYTVGDDIDNPQAILVRSASMHEMELGDDLLAIARAGAGVNKLLYCVCVGTGSIEYYDTLFTALVNGNIVYACTCSCDSE